MDYSINFPFLLNLHNMCVYTLVLYICVCMYAGLSHIEKILQQLRKCQKVGNGIEHCITQYKRDSFSQYNSMSALSHR